MKIHGPRLLLTAISLAVVLSISLRDIRSPQPGPLSRTHAQLNELLGADNCAACHGDDALTMAQACEVCHEPIRADRRRGLGLHGSLPDALSTDCASCHGEHLGRSFQPTSERSFRLAGVPDQTRFDHSLLGYQVVGHHTELACEACHENAESPRLSEGQRRFGGLSRACSSCHEDVHEGRMTPDCAACHDPAQPFEQIATFEHASVFADDGAHRAAACAECHPGEGVHAIDVLLNQGLAPISRSCVACHASPHGAGFIESLALTESVTADNSCALCHDATHDGFAGQGQLMDLSLHEASGFSLDPPHALLSCGDCHGSPKEAPAATFAARFPGRNGSECASCHDDPHGGQFDDVNAVSSDCLACHGELSFHPSLIDIERHASTGFPLVDSHQAVGCDSCHLADSDSPAAHRVFRSTPTSCALCHDDPHREAFVDADAGGLSDCARCHQPTLFEDIPAGAFDHGLELGFPLDGAHAASACEACHPRTPQADSMGRRFGRVEVAPGLVSGACENCHIDAHEGRLHDRDLGQGFGDSEGCASCHTTSSFSEVKQETFDHETDTGFILDGAHLSAACETCHEPSGLPDSSGRRFGVISDLVPPPVTRCDSCHSDAHWGSFNAWSLPGAVDGQTSCATCHSTTSFSDKAADLFDHLQWTGYDVGEGHAAVACAACHPPLDLPDGRGRTTMLAAGRSCNDCHEDPHVGQFAEAGHTDCARCHTPAALLTFDHGRDSRFSIDEQHGALDCADCHQLWPLPSGGEAVRYKPLGLDCADCHGPTSPLPRNQRASVLPEQLTFRDGAR